MLIICDDFRGVARFGRYPYELRFGTNYNFKGSYTHKKLRYFAETRTRFDDATNRMDKTLRHGMSYYYFGS